MPGFTPRGYEYPLYTDAGHNFPADIQALAEDIDADVQAQVNTLTGALAQPSVRVSSTATQAVAANTDVTVTWDTEDFDNGGIWVIGSPTIFTFTEVGLYLISASARWPSNADSTLSSCGLRIVSSATGTRARHEVRRGVDSVPDTIQTFTHVATLHEIAAPGETISIVARHNMAVASAVIEREFSATKISEDN
jgi:hypothetical protein